MIHNIELIKLPTKNNDSEVKRLGQRLQLLHNLCDLWYSYPECICGGCFHVLLDDGNMRDSDLQHSADNLQQEKWGHIRELGEAILGMLKTLSPAQRLYWWELRAADKVLEVAGKDIDLTDKGYVVKK